jgi:hypothetical protein
MPIELEITHFFEQVEIPEDELKSLLGVASWQSEPQFPYPGRSAWHVFKKPVHLKKVVLATSSSPEGIVVGLRQRLQILRAEQGNRRYASFS